jgi:hypothetical protein
MSRKIRANASQHTPFLSAARLAFRPLLWALASSVFLLTHANAYATENAAWMRHNWGVRIVLPSGDMKQVATFKPRALVEQLAALKTPKWVQINLTRPARGGFYTAPDAMLAQIDPRMVPKRDIFGETIAALHEHGFRVIVYFASQGPDLEYAMGRRANSPFAKRQRRDSLAVGESWARYLSSNGLKHVQEVARLCIAPFSRRYGKQIDGWWFDHGQYGDDALFTAAAREGNPTAAIAWNQKHNVVKLRGSDDNSDSPRRNIVWDLAKSIPDEDYTAGHITPTRLQSPSWRGNERILETMERNTSIGGAVPHLFVPLQRTWRSGKSLFDLEQALSWTKRAVFSNGALTWVIALRRPEYQHSEIEPTQFAVLFAMDKALLADATSGVQRRALN